MHIKGVFLCLIVLVFCSCSFNSLDEKYEAEVYFDDEKVLLELADTSDEREIGLMYRENLDFGYGMLFLYKDEGKRSFWMKNTLIPLDIIWIDDKFKIVAIQNALPCVEDPCDIYNPLVEARYIVEVPLGYANLKGIEVGDEVLLSVY